MEAAKAVLLALTDLFGGPGTKALAVCIVHVASCRVCQANAINGPDNRLSRRETAAGSKGQFDGADADLVDLYWLASFLCPLFKVLKLPPNGGSAQSQPDD